MKELRQLPFATYDLAVYLPGGAVVLVIFLAVLDHWFPGNQFVPHLKFDKGTIGQIMKGVFWLAASYLSGHVSSFV